MLELLWRRMQHPPLLVGALASYYSDPETCARDLQTGFQVLDVGSYRGNTVASEPFSLRSATLSYGDLVICSFAGSGLHSHLQSDRLAFFVLPGRGLGHYRLLGERINVNAGETLGFLPPCEFQVTNTITSGTLLGFTLASLQRRIAAIGGNADASSLVHPELQRPRTVLVQSSRQELLVATILQALELIDRAVQTTGAPPPAALALDDLVLRSIALLLAPAPYASPQFSCRSLQQAVDLAMAWMRANLERPISLTDIELQVGYGRRSLQDGFRRRVGCGPMQWLRRQRLETAHSLIVAMASGVEQPLSLKQVAHRCGYINFSAFSRDFSALHGYPPSHVLRRRG